MDKKLGRKNLHMIGHAHIDPVWLWRWPEGLSEIRATFRSALDRMEEYPDFLFSQSSAFFYKWIQLNDPEMFSEIKKRVEENRWSIVGGWWVEPDCNIPSGESFARQALYAQKYFKKEFGRYAETGFCPDSFGHNAMLPRLLEQGGMSGYVMMRPDPHEMTLPSNCFIWRGADGFEIPVFKIKGSYRSFDRNFIEILDDTRSFADEKQADLMCFYGVGNHGGGPTRRNIEIILERKDQDNLKLSTPDEYFNRLDKTSLPIVEGPLHHHAVGCYSAYSEIKTNNRKVENLARTAESFALIAATLLGCEFYTDSIRESWEKILFAQFHDSLCGCCIDEACKDAVKLFGEAQCELERVLYNALIKLAWQIDTMPSENAAREKTDWLLWENSDMGTPLIVFNPTGFSYHGVLRVEKNNVSVLDDNGSALITQAVEASRCNEDDNSDTLFIADIPPYGYNTYWIHTLKQPTIEAFKSNEDSRFCLENSEINAVFDFQGNLSQLWDKTTGCQILSAPLVFTILDDSANDTWAHGVDGFYEKEAVFFPHKTQIIENGPIRSTIRTYYEHNASKIRVDYILSEVGPLKLEIRTNITDRRCIVRMCVPTVFSEPECEYEIPYGVTSAKTDGRETPMQRFVDVHDDLHGITVLNTGRYSFCANKNELKIILARTALTADHFGKRCDRQDGIYMDSDTLFTDFYIVPHGEGWKENANKLAEQIHREPICILDTYHRGHFDRKNSWISCDKSNICIDVLKRAEDGGGYVLRIHEIGVMECEVNVKLAYADRLLALSLKKNEIKTVFIPDDLESIPVETTFLED